MAIRPASDSGNPCLVLSHARLPLFNDVRERLGAGFVAALEQALPEVAAELERGAESAGSGLARRDLFAAAAMLRIEAAGRAQRALGALYDLSFRLLELGEIDAPELPTELLPDPELDARIVADGLAQAIRERLGERYEGWRRRVDGLLQHAPAEPVAPIGAVAIAHAAVLSLRPMTSDRATRAVVAKVMVERFATPLGDAIVAADDWLARQHVAPWSPPVADVAESQPADEDGTGDVGAIAVQVAAPRPVPIDAAAEAASNAARFDAVTGARDTAPAVDTTPSPPADGRAPGVEAEPAASAEPPANPEASTPAAAPASNDTADAAMTRAAQALVHDTEVADLLGTHPMAGSKDAATGYRHAGALARPSALEQDAIAFAHRMGVPPYTRDARRHFFAALRARMIDAHAGAAQLATLDLVAAMFDYTIDDARIAEAAKPLLWRLQHPSVTLVALDAGFLGDDRRSLRRLVENVAAISVAYADDLTQGSELHRRIETVVRAVEVVAHAFQARSAVLSVQVRREYERAQQGVSQLVSRIDKERRALEATPARRNRRDFARRPSAAREQEVTHRLRALIDERVHGREVPESVREFLHGAWLRHLRTALLRDGEDSAAYTLSMQVVDDLLWTLDGGGRRASRKQLARRIPPLLKLLTQGIGDIGGRPEDYRPFLDELFVMHLRRMQRDPREPAPDTTRPGPEPAPSAEPATDAAPPTLQERLPEQPTATRSEPTRPVAVAASSIAAAAAPSEPPAPASPPAPIAPPPHATAPPADLEPHRTPDGASDAVSPAAVAEPPRHPIGRVPPATAEADHRSGEERLLTVLGTVDLADFPEMPERLRLPPDDALARLQRGDWLELLGRDGLPQEVKVAWINARRTVVLLVRRPDRRAMSLRTAELHQRFAQHRASLIVRPGFSAPGT